MGWKGVPNGTEICEERMVLKHFQERELPGNA